MHQHQWNLRWRDLATPDRAVASDTRGCDHHRLRGCATRDGPRLRPALRPADPALVLPVRSGGRGRAVVCDLRVVRPPCAWDARPAVSQPAGRALWPIDRARDCGPVAEARDPGPGHRRGARRVHRRPKPVPQYRAHSGVDHLVGGVCLRFGRRRRPVGGDQSLAHGLRRRGLALSPSDRPGRAVLALALSAGAWRLAGVRAPVRLLPGSSWSIRARRSRRISRAWLSATRSSPGPGCCCSAATPGCGTAKFSPSSSARSRVSPHSRSTPAAPPRSDNWCYARSARGCSPARRFRPR